MTARAQPSHRRATTSDPVSTAGFPRRGCSGATRNRSAATERNDGYDQSANDDYEQRRSSQARAPATPGSTPGGRAPAVRENIVLRLANFLRGSWRELQRVQWPDRRQVVQATAVVIGFVIVAGIYLGLADEVASKLVNFVLK